MHDLLTQESVSFVDLEDFHSTAKNADVLDLLLEADAEGDLDAMELILCDLEYLAPNENLEGVRILLLGSVYRMWVKVG